MVRTNRTKRVIDRPAGDAGATAIEFAIISPVLLMLLMALVEIGLASHQAIRTQAAAEAGAVYATVHGFDAAGIVSAVEGATNLSGLTASPPPEYVCGCPNAATGVTVVNCSATCPGGSSPGEYAYIYATYTHATLLPYPWPSAPVELTGEAVVRLK